MKLLERETLLAQLQEQFKRAMAGPGVLAFVEGEAGIGKTALLRALADGQRAGTPVYWGACDALQTPRPLGPLYEIAMQAGGELQSALDTGMDRLRVFTALLDLLRRRPSLVLMEDLHWADEATLDLLRYLGRRIERTRSLVVASFRSDEITSSHPLRLVLGDLATTGVQRFVPQPLSVDAISKLAEQTVDAAMIHRVTGGNPFFATEVLVAGGQGVPVTIRDAVLARAARLHSSARAILDAAAVAGPRIEPWLLHELAGTENKFVDECLTTGVLCVNDGLFAFRHELARQAILGAMTPTRLLSLHRLVLHVLQSPVAPSTDLARLAHHAEGAQLAEAVAQFAPAAAREAASKGAHRQAAQQFARALRYAAPDPAPRASLLDNYASECHLAGMMDEAINARQNAATSWRQVGDSGRQAITLARMAHSMVIDGHNVAAEATMREALALIESQPETQAAVTTHRWAAYLRMLDRDLDSAVREGRIAMVSAERLGDPEASIHCLNTIGSSLILQEQVDEGLRHLEESRALAERLQYDLWVALALGNLGTACGEVYRLDLAEDALRRCIEFSIERDIESARLYQSSWLALIHLYRGRWKEATDVAHAVLAEPSAQGIARMMALIALGRVRARRGDPGTWEALDEARALAAKTITLQRVAPVQAARAEAAWLEGRIAEAASEAVPGIELAVRKQHAWFTSELMFWSCAVERPVRSKPPDFCTNHPFSLEIAGHWRAAAAAWRALGCPFETARALSEGDEPAQREALATFESLGAHPMVERVRHKLRSAGARGLRRGPRESTRKHPSGLTSKEVAVLTLLSQGMRTKEIGQRLNRSARTIDHHLAAIFVKLNVSSRAEAVSTAHRLGIV